MPDATPDDVRSLIEDTRKTFSDLDGPETEMHQIVSGAYPYKQKVPPALANIIGGIEDTRIGLPAMSLTRSKALFFAGLDWPLLPIINGLKESDNDAMEAFFARQSKLWDPLGVVHQTTLNHMVTSRFGVEYQFTKAKPAQKPGEPDEDYKARCQGHSRHGLESLSPDSIGATIRGGIVTLGAIAEKIPAVRVPALYGDRDKATKGGYSADGARWWLEQFPGLKLSDGRGVDSASSTDFLKDEVERLIFCTDTKICHYIKQPGMDGKDTYAEMEGHSFPTTFGRVPLYIYTGTFNPHFPMAERYAGLIWPLAVIERNIALIDSIIATMAANPRTAVRLDPNVQQQGESAIAFAERATGAANIPDVPGDVVDFMPPSRDDLIQTRNGLVEQRNYILQDLTNMFISQDTARTAPASSILYVSESAQRALKQAMTSIVMNKQQQLLAVAHDMTYLKDEVAFRMAGDEYGRKKYEAGKEYRLSPEKFKPFVEGTATITVKPVVETESQKAALGAQVLTGIAQGVETPTAYYESQGITDITGKEQELLEWNLAQLDSPRVISMAQTKANELIAAFLETDPAELQAASAEVAPAEGAVSDEEVSGQGYRLQTPATAAPSGASGI